MEAGKVPLWLATISPNRVAPELREKFEHYLEDVAKILEDVFMGSGFAVNPNPERVDTEAMKNKLQELQVKKLGLLHKSFEILSQVEGYNPKALAPLIEQGARDMMGVGMGEKTLIDVSDFLKERGITKIRSAAPAFGKVAREIYCQRKGQEPPKYQRFVDGAQRLINSYTTEDLDILEEAFFHFTQRNPDYLN